MHNVGLKVQYSLCFFTIHTCNISTCDWEYILNSVDSFGVQSALVVGLDGIKMEAFTVVTFAIAPSGQKSTTKTFFKKIHCVTIQW